MMSPSSLNSDILESGLEFVLSHFPDPVYPRTISTKNTSGRQVLVYSKDEIVARFRSSNFTDCRINAYPNTSGPITPSLLFIDIDKSNFRTKVGLTRALNNTLMNIRTRLSALPTVLWTGGGYHIYQPIDGIPLENISNFNTIGHPSTKFLRWAAKYLSNDRSDRNNFQSTKSCMLRVPGSINSKYSVDDQVKIIQPWSGFRPSINLMLGSFYAWTIGDRIKNNRTNVKPKKLVGTTQYLMIPWIEELLKTPIDDGRKNAVSLILAPYLVNIKMVAVKEAYFIIATWLKKCELLRKLDFDFNYIINYSLQRSIKNGYKPLRLSNLKLRNKVLFDLITHS